MQLRPDALFAQLRKDGASLRRLYTVHGDEALLAQECADAIRAAARAAGYGERRVFTVAGAHYRWDELLAAPQELSLFAERRLIEIRIPSGKPGKDGSEALQRYCSGLARQGSDDVLTLVQLPRLDSQQLRSAWFAALDAEGVTLRVDPVERPALPAWIAQRLAAQGQRVVGGDEGQRTLQFIADRVEGNLLAAHQEILKLGLLHPSGELRYEQVEAAVLDVARYDTGKLSEALLAGQAERALRMLDGLRADGTPVVFVHWTLANDISALHRVKLALADGRPMPLAMREARVWGAKERLMERLLPRLSDTTIGAWLEAAQICDGLAKGLPHPQWPQDPWEALRRLLLMLLSQTAALPPRQAARLALQG